MFFPKEARFRVALAGYYGFGNLGDELLAGATVDLLERCGVARARIVVLSNDPEDSRRKFGTAVVNRWKPTAVAAALRRSDTLLFGGGGLFQDVTSLRSCGYYWGLARLARLCGASVWALGQSVGPLRTRAGRFFARNALRACRVTQVRDDVSRVLCETMGIPVVTGQDLTFSLAETLRRKMALLPSSNSRKILVNIRPHIGDTAARFARALGDMPSRLPFAAGAAFQGVALAEEDERLMRFLIKRGDLPPMPVERVRTLDDAARLWKDADGALGMRLHFAVLSAMAETPLAVAPYDPKVGAFAAAWNVPVWIAPAWDGEGMPAPAIPVAPRDAEQNEKTEDLCRKVLA